MSSEEEARPAGENAKKDGVVKLDSILGEVGPFGRFQIRTLLLAALPVVFSGFFGGEYVFTTARIPTRCRIPQCDGTAAAVPLPEFRPEWVLNAINGTSRDSFEACARFPDRAPQPPSNDTCPADWFERTTQVDCEEYVYENTNSVVYDFQIACQEWRRSQIGSYRVLGSFVAMPLTGYVSDRWGRRAALALAGLHLCWTGIVRSFITSYEWYLFSKALSALAAGMFATAYILVTELVGPRYRVLVGASISSLFALGNVLVALVAWGVPTWRQFTRVIYIPQVVAVFYFWMFPESVRWLMSKGRYEEAEVILKKVAKVNKKELSDKSLQMLRAAAEAEKLAEKPKEQWLVLLVFRSRALLFRCLVTPIWWITNILVYYGLSINAVNLSGNAYLNYVAVSAVEVPGFWAAILLLDRVGRKPVLIGGYFICAICQFIFPFLSRTMSGLSLAVYLVGKCSISMVVTSVYVYTAELFPTRHRHQLFGFASMMGRIGSLVAPLTPSLAQEVWGPLPSVLFGSLALLSGLLLFWTPETLGTKLPDTMAEAEDLNSSRRDK